MLESLRNELLASYKPKLMDGTPCAICGATGKPLSLHVLEYYHDSAIASPAAFVPMSQSRGTTRGSAPICTSCASPCSKCGLPIATPWHKKLGTMLQSQAFGVTIRHGQGYCRHVHPLADLLSLFKPVRTASPKSSSQSSQPAEKRVQAALAEIERAETLPGFSLVRDGICEQLRDVARTRASIDEDGLTPEALVFLLASNVANAELCSGQHHIYRGVLSQSGRTLLTTFEKASQLIVECGVHSQDEHERDMNSIRKEIAEIG